MTVGYCLNLLIMLPPIQEPKYGKENKEIFKKGLEELFSVKIRYDSIVDDNGPSIIVNNDIVLQAYSDIINRGCRNSAYYRNFC